MKINDEMRTFFMLSCVLLGLYVLIFKAPNLLEYNENRNCAKEIDCQYFGMIDSVNTSLYIKSWYFFIENNRTRHYLWKNTVKYLAKGDSIVKTSGESQYIIFKKSINNDSILILKFDCD
jgi:hypothetical protein